jgi:hypothetical protein
MKVEIPIHTIIPLVAPSNSGKSYFAKNVLIPQLKEKYPELNVQYIASDDIRRESLGDDVRHKHDPEMLQVSDQAFKLLQLKLEVATSFPICAEIIIVDTTGLAESFREQMLAHGKKTNYNVVPIVFDYENRDDYYSHKDESVKNFVIAKHITKLRKEVLKTINKKKYIDVIKIREKDFSGIEVIVNNYNFYRSHFLPVVPKKEYMVVGDLHGCLDEFKELIQKSNCEIDENGLIQGDKIFIVQDYVDKGYAILELISFIHKNWKNGTIIPLIGNHENYVYKRLTGEIKEDKTLEDSYFNSCSMLLDQANVEFKDMFIELFLASKHFFKHKNFFVNHAPCPEKYLGKIDNISLKKQRNFVYPKRKDFDNDEVYIGKLEEELSFIQDYKSWNSKPVVWGHIAIRNTVRMGNTMMIDTGCVSGNKLCGVSFNDDGQTFFKVVSSKDNQKITEVKELLSLFANKQKKDVLLDDLEADDLKRIRYLIWNKINYIAGTMCPADKDLESNELESLKQGLLYYKENNVDRVILQKKYMGSNSVNYLFKDIEKCYSTSRNGFKIDKRVDLTLEYQRLLTKYVDFFEAENVECMVLNSELMPWSALGKGLIAESFMPVQIGSISEYDLLQENGFWDELNKTIKHPLMEEYVVDARTSTKQQLVDKYGYRVHETLRNAVAFVPEYITPEEYKDGMEVYKRQLELFGGDGEPLLLPFSLLKIIRTDGTEELSFDKSNIDIFDFVSDDEYFVVEFSDGDWYEKAEAFYDRITKGEELEGIVIKPEMVYTKHLAPYIKCRSPRYLTMTYSFDYKKTHKYNKLIHKKYIKRKLKASIDEFEIGKKMLEIPYAEIVDGNQAFVNLCAAMIIDEKIVQKLDPRL